jgi:hypothetical protein
MQTFEILFYTAPEGSSHIEVFYEEETFWLSQKKMAELFGVEANTINYHLKEIFKTNELEENPTTRNFRVVQKEGSRLVSRDVDFYNLDAIIAVGYRVNSLEATRFRIWASSRTTSTKRSRTNCIGPSPATPLLSSSRKEPMPKNPIWV